MYRDCVIEYVGLEGGAPRAYERSRGDIDDLAADATSVYWIDVERGEIAA